MTRVFLPLLLICGLLCNARAAEGAKRVVVMPFSGPRGAAATAAVKRALRGVASVSASRFAHLARQGQRRAAAARLGVAAIVRGHIRRSRGRWVLRLSVRNADNNRVVGSTTFALRGARVDPSTARSAARAVRRYLRRCRVPGGATVARRRRSRPARRRRRRRRVARVVRSTPRPRRTEKAPRRSGFDDGSDLDNAATTHVPIARVPASTPPPATVQQTPPPRAAGQPPQQTPRRVARARSDVDDALGFKVAANTDGDERPGTDNLRVTNRKREGSDDDKEDDVVDRPRRKRGRPYWETIVEIYAGLQLVRRTLFFKDHELQGDVEAFKMNGVVAALAFSGVLHPLAAFYRNSLADIGIVARFNKILGLQAGTGSEKRDVFAQMYELGLRYRVNLTGRGTSPELRFGIGYGHQAFAFEGPARSAVVQPNISYDYIKLSPVDVEWAFISSRTFRFGIDVTFDYMLVLSAGDIEREDSAGYGSGFVGGLDVGGGLFISIHGFTARLRGFYRRYFYAFDQSCTGCQRAGGALEIYSGGTFDVGYAY